uniref:Uncharacterized protein n=1 Tax=Spodoptera littoralis nuclear polyhedrosis virus TaxID=10456 RepID=A0A3G4S8Y9_NPVSL|nr:hypothetical protein [Spodoptera littoralis nucleopolyhedrovirus]
MAASKVYNPSPLYNTVLRKIFKEKIDTKDQLPRTIMEDLQIILPEYLPGWYIYRFEDGVKIMVVCKEEQDYDVNKRIVDLYKSTRQPDEVAKNLSYAMYDLFGDLEDIFVMYDLEGKDREHLDVYAMQYCLFALNKFENVRFTKRSSGIFTFQRCDVDEDFISITSPVVLTCNY